MDDGVFKLIIGIILIVLGYRLHASVKLSNDRMFIACIIYLALVCGIYVMAVL